VSLPSPLRSGGKPVPKGFLQTSSPLFGSGKVKELHYIFINEGITRGMPEFRYTASTKEYATMMLDTPPTREDIHTAVRSDLNELKWHLKIRHLKIIKR
jgi:hypothetical protein